MNKWFAGFAEANFGRISTVLETFHDFHCGRIPDEQSRELDRAMAHWFSHGICSDAVMEVALGALAPVLPTMPDGATAWDWLEDPDALTNLTPDEAVVRIQQWLAEFGLNTVRAPDAVLSRFLVFLRILNKSFIAFMAEELISHPAGQRLFAIVKEFDDRWPLAFACDLSPKGGPPKASTN